jgi:4-oxalocrotonate tautomerase
MFLIGHAIDFYNFILKHTHMPHVIIKLFPGKSEEQKKELADEIVKDFIQLFQYREEALSVAIEEVPREEWTEEVYKKEILGNMERLYKKPGYDPF